MENFCALSPSHHSAALIRIFSFNAFVSLTLGSIYWSHVYFPSFPLHWWEHWLYNKKFDQKVEKQTPGKCASLYDLNAFKFYGLYIE